jgi:plasmid stabilization system protein ParE
MKIIWTPLSVDRVSEIADYIARDKPSAAEKWINPIFSKVEQLKTSPFQRCHQVRKPNLT